VSHDSPLTEIKDIPILLKKQAVGNSPKALNR
jgi:hypothetical protein